MHLVVGAFWLLLGIFYFRAWQRAVADRPAWMREQQAQLLAALEEIGMLEAELGVLRERLAADQLVYEIRLTNLEAFVMSRYKQTPPQPADQQ